MIALISPSKAQDFSPVSYPFEATQAQYLSSSQELIKLLRKYSKEELMQLMDISEDLASLNLQRYKDFSLPFTPQNAKPALLAFTGDVYGGFDLESYSADDYAFAQAHLRILSGLYGLLRPTDLIQPYRLEMGIPLPNKEGKNLYLYWGNKPALALAKPLEQDESHVLVNLASSEYSKAVNTKKVKANRIVTPVFKEKKGNEYKMIGLFAKKARGLMCNFMIKNRLVDPEDLKAFEVEGYKYRQELSTQEEWVFTRG